MGMKDRMRRVESQAEDRRVEAELGDIFAVNMARLEALAKGETPPPAHPRSENPRYSGTYLGAEMVICDEDEEPLLGSIPDLSE